MSKPHPALIELAAGRGLVLPDDTVGLIRSAEEHRMLGLLTGKLGLSDLGLPDSDLRQIAMLQLRSRASQRRLWNAATEVLAKLDAIGVAALVFKGVVAEARWYKRIGDRPATDIDILIEPDFHDRVWDIVSALSSSHPYGPEIDALVTKGVIQAVAVRLDTGEVVDIHFDLPALGVPTRSRHQVWARSRVRNLGDGYVVRVLDNETALIQLLLHLNKDCFARLLWYSDIARLLKSEASLDWDYISEFARTEGLEVPIAMSLDAVCTDLGIASPCHLHASGWKAFVWQRLWPEKVRLLGLEGYYRRRHRRYFLAFMFRGRFWSATRWWLRQVFPPRAILDTTDRGVSGPYLWRLVRSRVARGVENYRFSRWWRD